MSHRMMGRKRVSGPQMPFFTFKTTFEGEVSFSITQSGGALATWYMGDGTIIADTNAVTHTYADGTEKTVSVAVEDFGDVTAIGDLREKQITFFDAKDLNDLSASFTLANNPMASVLMPTSQIGAFSFIQVWSTLLSELNLQGVNFDGLARIWAQNCNLSAIAIKSGEVVNDLRLENNDFTTIDLSQVIRNNANTGFQWNFSESPNLTGVSMPSNNQPQRLGVLRAFSCPLLTEFDISMFSPGGVRTIEFYNSTGLSSITWPAIDSVNLESNSLRVDDTDIEFIDLRWNTFGFGPGARLWIMNTPNAKWLKVAPGSVYRFAQQSNNINCLRAENSAIESIDFSPAASVSGNLRVINCPNLTEFLFPADTGTYNPFYIYFINCPLLTSSLPIGNYAISVITSQFHVINCPLVTEINCETLDTITCPSVFIQNTGVTELDFSNWRWNGGTAQVLMIGNANLQRVVLAEVTGAYSNGWRIVNNPNLTEIEFNGGAGWGVGGNEVDFRNNALTAQSIDKLLVDLDNFISTTNKGLRLEGGTNSPPTDGSVTGFDGIAAKASLELKGMTITTN